jgi:hypothetical protein
VAPSGFTLAAGVPKSLVAMTTSVATEMRMEMVLG